jgi:hypothetical protein
MKLLNLLSVGLFLAMPTLQAQWYADDVQYYDNNTTVDVWISVSPADGSWQAGGDTFFPGVYGCELCSTDASISVELDEDGYYLTSNSYSDPNGNASTEYVSSTIIDLGANYQVYGNHSWGAGGASTYCSILTPNFPTSIVLTGVDASNPYSTAVYFGTYPPGSLYSSALSIAGETSISESTENPYFTFNEPAFIGPPQVPTSSPFEFEGMLAGHAFTASICYVTVWRDQFIDDFWIGSFYEGGVEAGAPAYVSVKHYGNVNYDTYTYCPAIITPTSEVIRINTSYGSIDTSNNACTIAECEIYGMVETTSAPDGQTYRMSIVPGTAPTGTYQIQSFDWYSEWFPDENVPMGVCNIDLDVEQFHGAGTSHWVAGCIGKGDPLGFTSLIVLAP